MSFHRSVHRDRALRTRLQHLLVLLALVGAASGLAPPASALDRCELRQKSDGTLQVSARGIVGPLRVGTAPEVIESRFFNASRCIDGRAARKCVLADKGNPLRTSPPPYCKLYLEDDEDSCTAKLKGCTPGLRPTCPPDMERMGSTCIEKSADGGKFAEAVNACAARGRQLCTQPEIMSCDSTNLSNARRGSCGWYTDGGGRLWLHGSSSEDGRSAYGRLRLHAPDNRIIEVPSDQGSINDFFCCAPLGTP